MTQLSAGSPTKKKKNSLLTKSQWLKNNEVSRVVKVIEIESRMVVTRNWWWGQYLMFNEYKISKLQDKNVLEFLFYNTMNILDTTVVNTEKWLRW